MKVISALFVFGAVMELVGGSSLHCFILLAAAVVLAAVSVRRALL